MGTQILTLSGGSREVQGPPRGVLSSSLSRLHRKQNKDCSLQHLLRAVLAPHHSRTMAGRKKEEAEAVGRHLSIVKA